VSLKQLKGIFGFLKSREEAIDSRFYTKTVRKLRAKCQVAEDYIEYDILLLKEGDSKRAEKYTKKKTKLKAAFRKFKV